MLFVLSPVCSFTQPPATRAFYVTPHASYTGQIQLARIYFYDDPSAELSVRSSASSVSARLNGNSFDSMYHILQTEDPVYFGWIDGSFFRMWTSEEEPGEGYMDFSCLAP
jgi:hypothetical protein